jgi:hypothetical protein
MTSHDSSNSPIGCKYASRFSISASTLNAGVTGVTGATRGRLRRNPGRNPGRLRRNPCWTWRNCWLCHGQQTEPGGLHQLHPPCGPGNTCKCLNSHYVSSVTPVTLRKTGYPNYDH